MESLTKPCVATFIDYDNIYVTLKEDFITDNFEFDTLPAHFRRISSSIGRVNYAKAYANWMNRGAGIMQAFGANLINVTHVFPKKNGKDRSDASIIVDAMELLYTKKNISHFVLFSGDSDFRELALKITSMDKTLCVCCFSHVLGADLRAAADYNFIPLEGELKLHRKPKAGEAASDDYSPLIRSLSRVKWDYIGWVRYRDTYLASTYPNINWEEIGARNKEGNLDAFLERAVQDGVIKREEKKTDFGSVMTIKLMKNNTIVKEVLSAIQ